jgi:hypothetical protein
MVYCTKCGTQNPDDAQSCSKCMASLNPAPYREHKRYRGEEDACFGGRNYMWGIIIGLFIIMLGVSNLLGGNVWEQLWPMFLILLGVIIIGSAFLRNK